MSSNIPPFLQMIGLQKTEDPWVFEGTSLPLPLGNLRPIAYGGFAIATAINAAGQTMPKDGHFVPYSLTGHFLGPASLKTPYVCEVQPVRDTRTFCTRFVTVKQRSSKGDLRSVLSITLDLINSPDSTKEALQKAKEAGIEPACKGSLLRYGASPPWVVEHANDLLPFDKISAQLVKSGEIDASVVKMQSDFLDLWNKLFEMRPVPHSVLFQNSMGMSDQPTTQDKLAITQRRSFDWMHMNHRLPAVDGSEGPVPAGPNGTLPVPAVIAHIAVMAFALDGAIAFAPLSLANKSIFDAEAASTLEFAQRFHTDVPDMNQWLLREILPINAGWQRTYSEARLFDHDGHHIATCSQQCVLRPADGDVVAEPWPAPKPMPTPASKL
ncbi:acyl- thioesterase ii [Malassezia pachydermatis]|uniref:Acyl-thioesterase ii n=1 Tax=Malassezia pachydermatis TaxID=77020 RepID=A0A0M9VNC2_9BASI|nr:acyl- thioesterase ii [Malassezia pachydermatis]KOS12932.1 acyl- thioesterase ii [Malassezia pachydermatis]